MFIKSGDLSRVLQKTQIKDSQNSQVSCFLVNDLKVQVKDHFKTLLKKAHIQVYQVHFRRFK